eukprot:scaffold869_cov303-Pinguiococcus_pyrenoidosus.AAC.9
MQESAQSIPPSEVLASRCFRSQRLVLEGVREAGHRGQGGWNHVDGSPSHLLGRVLQLRRVCHADFGGNQHDFVEELREAVALLDVAQATREERICELTQRSLDTLDLPRDFRTYTEPIINLLGAQRRRVNGLAQRGSRCPPGGILADEGSRLGILRRRQEAGERTLQVRFADGQGEQRFPRANAEMAAASPCGRLAAVLPQAPQGSEKSRVLVRPWVQQALLVLNATIVHAIKRLLHPSQECFLYGSTIHLFSPNGRHQMQEGLERFIPEIEAEIDDLEPRDRCVVGAPIAGNLRGQISVIFAGRQCAAPEIPRKEFIARHPTA